MLSIYLGKEFLSSRVPPTSHHTARLLLDLWWGLPFWNREISVNYWNILGSLTREGGSGERLARPWAVRKPRRGDMPKARWHAHEVTSPWGDMPTLQKQQVGEQDFERSSHPQIWGLNHFGELLRNTLNIFAFPSSNFIIWLHFGCYTESPRWSGRKN